MRHGCAHRIIGHGTHASIACRQCLYGTCGLLQQLSSACPAAEMTVCAGEQCKCVLLLAVAILLLCCWFVDTCLQYYSDTH